MKTPLLCAFLLEWSADALGAAPNLVLNPDFTLNADGWGNLGGGQNQWLQNDGDPTPGSLNFIHQGACDCQQFAMQCVTVTPGARYRFQYSVKRVASSPTYMTLTTYVYWFDAPGCPTFDQQAIWIDGAYVDDLALGMWQTRNIGFAAVPPTARSVRVLLGAVYTGGPSQSLLFDHVVFEQDTVFANGFE